MTCLAHWQTMQTVRTAEMCADYQNCNPQPVRNSEIRFRNVYFDRKDLRASRFITVMLQSEKCKVPIQLSMQRHSWLVRRCASTSTSGFQCSTIRTPPLDIATHQDSDDHSNASSIADNSTLQFQLTVSIISINFDILTITELFEDMPLPTSGS